MRPGTRAAAASAWIFALAVAAVAQDQAPQGWHTHPMCWQEPRIYHEGGPSSFEDAARRQISITRVKEALPKPFTVSPNHAYAFHPPSDLGTSRFTSWWPSSGPTSSGSRPPMLSAWAISVGSTDSCKAWEGTPNACQVTCYPLK